MTYAIQITNEAGETFSEDLPGDQPGGLVEAFLIEQIGWQQAKTVTIFIGEVMTDDPALTGRRKKKVT